MTEKRNDEVGIHSLDKFTLEVPDLDVANKFYSAFGLDVHRTADALSLRTFGHDHVWGVIKKGPRKRLGHVTFGAYREDMPVFRRRLAEYGITPEASPAGSEDAIWFRDPVGMLVELRVAPKSSPEGKPAHAPLPSIVAGRATRGRREAPTVRPRRLAHALLFTPDIAKSIDFYCKVLGLRISDFPGPVGFLHGVHGSDHHLIAFGQSPDGIGYHHSSWDVDTFEAVGQGAMQMERAGYGTRGWGLGRHVLGSNYFHYIRDPWDSFVEYNFDIDFIPKGTAWTPAETEPEDMLYLWGPAPPEDFVTNYEQR
jgi:catechol 2,3-dioxygenase